MLALQKSHVLAEEYVCEKVCMLAGVPFARSFIEKTEELRVSVINYRSGEIEIEDLRERLEAVRRRLEDEQAIPMLRYIDEGAEEQYRVHIHNNSLCYFRETEGYIKIDTDGEYSKVFGRTPLEDEKEEPDMPIHRRGKSSFCCLVIDGNGQMFMFPYKGNVMQHTFITRGENVIFAGMARVEDGKISYIDNNSGHYKFGSDSLPIVFSCLNLLSGREPDSKLPIELFVEGFDPLFKDFPKEKSKCIKLKGINFTNGFTIGAIEKTETELLMERRAVASFFVQTVHGLV